VRPDREASDQGKTPNKEKTQIEEKSEEDKQSLRSAIWAATTREAAV